MEEGQTRPGCRDPGTGRETAKEETTEESGAGEEEDGDGGTGDTEGTCYALRDMAEARGIHNFVKTKMLRSCLGGVAFFLVSRNVQARLFPSVLLVPFLLSARRSLPPSSPRFLLFFPPPATMCSLFLFLSLSLLRLLRSCPPCQSYLGASSLSRFSGNAPRNEKRFVKNVSASS